MADTIQTDSGGGQIGGAIALMLLANLLFSFVDTSTKWLIGAGLVAIQLAFMRYFMHFGVTLVETWVRPKRTTTLDPATRGLVLFRSFCLVSATVANFIALGHLPLAVTSAMLFLSPVLVCLIAKPILGEAVTPRHWIGVGFGFAGVLLIVQPFGNAVDWYALLMLYPATGMALYSVLTRKLSPRVPPAQMQFYTGALGTAALLPFALVHWQMPDRPLEWLLMCLIGLFAWAGHECLTRAHGHAAASTLAPFGYSFMLYLIVAGWLVFDEWPARHTLLGAALVLIAGLVVWRQSVRRTGLASSLVTRP